MYHKYHVNYQKTTEKEFSNWSRLNRNRFVLSHMDPTFAVLELAIRFFFNDHVPEYSPVSSKIIYAGGFKKREVDSFNGKKIRKESRPDHPVWNLSILKIVCDKFSQILRVQVIHRADLIGLAPPDDLPTHPDIYRTS